MEKDTELRITDYVIIDESFEPKKLADRVRVLIQNGWQPHGNLITNGKGRYLQAMVYIEKDVRRS